MTVYRMWCDHADCDWEALIDIDGEIGEWRPDRDTGLLDAHGDPIIDEWEGKLIDYSYSLHYQDVHEPDGDPPKCSWSAHQGHA